MDKVSPDAALILAGKGLRPHALTNPSPSTQARRRPTSPLSDGSASPAPARRPGAAAAFVLERPRFVGLRRVAGGFHLSLRLQILTNQPVLDPIGILGGFAHIINRKLHHIAALNSIFDVVTKVRLHVGKITPI